MQKKRKFWEDSCEMGHDLAAKEVKSGQSQRSRYKCRQKSTGYTFMFYQSNRVTK